LVSHGLLVLRCKGICWIQPPHRYSASRSPPYRHHDPFSPPQPPGNFSPSSPHDQSSPDLCFKSHPRSDLAICTKAHFIEPRRTAAPSNAPNDCLSLPDLVLLAGVRFSGFLLSDPTTASGSLSRIWEAVPPFGPIFLPSFQNMALCRPPSFADLLSHMNFELGCPALQLRYGLRKFWISPPEFDSASFFLFLNIFLCWTSSLFIFSPRL